ncbi:GNAT family N-acetyltransferase [Halalkalibacterium halodurans]|uniref:GNAT family N-acetyltransferase n=1 Tax=Halalkalibacterium halodurans TaxID=86665 RepID=UPI002E1C7E42|nr:GNAT family N-acetyltransferase [Halalkalibacterium halodurans]MED4086418.1 GNAT family N-acetyltransferase [Halalkalibacterium halodurans]MED4105046.1 GNAT family N-acetyltransferase [Halalkalibacterium halodurans]MED4110774.1 GNAT family N-acetyltransferase [Halalkalibacterium halodurans]MED4147546.1 GNAT family N-acetyltransferase [Halalkalibacterium halodurans]
MRSLIRSLTVEQEWLEAFPLIRQLRPHLTEASYLELVHEATKNEGYRMFALEVEDTLCAVIGFMPQTTLYNGKSIWVTDLVTDEHHRSNGYGLMLLAHVEAWAKTKGYEAISLSSNVSRTEAHRFYMEKGVYDKVSYVFKKRL